MFSANASQVSNDVKYIEDFCSVYLRTGTGSSQTVTTGVKENTGALVISKSRSAATDWAWYDTFRGTTKELASNTTAAEITQSQGLTSFNTDGHTWGTLAKVNTSGATYVDFVLKPTPKFFDVVTFTGTGSPQSIAHSLGSIPGCIIVKCTSTSSEWWVYHKDATVFGLPPRFCATLLNSTAGTGQYSTVWNETAPTSTAFTVGTASDINGSGRTYVAYIFAHDAGGFGLTGTDNVISCGSFTRTFGTANSVNIGYEPQWVLIKCTSQTDSWQLYDTMRGLSQTASLKLEPNSSNPESDTAGMKPTATGFDITATGIGGGSFIYIAIRRGPMKVPTDGTSVFSPVTQTSTGSAQAVTTNFPVDFTISRVRGATSANYVIDRLRGSTSASARILISNTTDPEYSGGPGFSLDSNTKITDNGLFGAGTSVIYECFRRAPGFFDVVCGDSGNATVARAHNLGVKPELIIAKYRDLSSQWDVYHKDLNGGVNPEDYYLELNGTSGQLNTADVWGASGPSATAFYKNIVSPYKGVFYLFASCPGVSKVGSYTGNGTSQTINCGFTAGARFVLIKRTDSTGDWYVWDSARGIVAGNDPYLLLNSTAAEVTTTDYVDTFSSGFEISSTAPAAINASGGTFIYLAIA